MVDITLKQVNPNTYTYHIKNRQRFETKLTSPVIQEPMPESAYSGQILTKLEGNSLMVTVSFMLKDYTPDGVTTLVDELTGGNAILTPMQQYNFLINTFENKGVLYKYQLSFTDGGITITYNGVIQELTIDQATENADNWVCTVQFIAGNVILVST